MRDAVPCTLGTKTTSAGDLVVAVHPMDLGRSRNMRRDDLGQGCMKSAHNFSDTPI